MSESEIHWICDSPSPYNTVLFKRLAATDGWNLRVHYRRSGLSSHPWQGDLRGGYPNRVFEPVLNIDWRLLALACGSPERMRRRWFVVAGWNNMTAALLLLILGLRGSRVLIWTDTPDLDRPRRGLRQMLRTRYLRWVFGRVRGVMGTGQPAVAHLARLGAPRSALHSFPCWIDERTFEGRGLEKSGKAALINGPVLFFSSGLLEVRRKGQDVALLALSRLAEAVFPEWQYRVAGTGPDREYLDSLAHELGIAHRVVCLGWLEPDAIRNEMLQADVFLHPSPVHEPYGVAVLEAMAAGLPVLASDKTYAAVDRVVPGVSGQIHAAGDAAQLAEHCKDLLLNPRMRVAMGAAARETAQLWPLSKAPRVLEEILRKSGKAE